MFNRTPLLRGLGICLTLAVGSGALAASAIDACGQLEQSGACVLFRANGLLYQLNTNGAFIAGDAVRVIGSIQESCNSPCSGVAGCVIVGEITYCDGPVSIVGTLTATSGCTILADERGQLIQIDNVGGFALGDRVIVSGEFNRRCEPRCSGIRRCIRSNSIVAAPLPPPSPPPAGNDPNTPASGSEGGASNPTGGSTADAGGAGGNGTSSGAGGAAGSGGAGGDGGAGDLDDTGISSGSGGTGGSSNGGGQSAGGVDDSLDESLQDRAADDLANGPVNDVATFLCPVLGFAVPSLTLLGMIRVRRRA